MWNICKSTCMRVILKRFKVKTHVIPKFSHGYHVYRISNMWYTYFTYVSDTCDTHNTWNMGTTWEGVPLLLHMGNMWNPCENMAITWVFTTKCSKITLLHVLLHAFHIFYMWHTCAYIGFTCFYHKMFQSIKYNCDFTCENLSEPHVQF